MGQKVHPYGLRLGIIKTWQSIWFADRKKYAQLLHEDIAIRALIKERLKHAAV
ncbi:MAG TPA: 30S ribosomal protein S3, partial [bacterium]|nr:30S ribosomal protein S3 [bacterium]